MKAPLLQATCGALISPAVFVPRRPQFSFRKTANAAMSGNRVTDTNSVTDKSSVKHDSNDIGTEVPGMDRSSPLRKEEQDSDLLRKQLGEPPEKPLPGDCCGSGCVRCVWDIYFEELDEYNSRKAALNGQRDSS